MKEKVFNHKKQVCTKVRSTQLEWQERGNISGLTLEMFAK